MSEFLTDAAQTLALLKKSEPGKPLFFYLAAVDKESRMWVDRRKDAKAIRSNVDKSEPKKPLAIAFGTIWLDESMVVHLDVRTKPPTTLDKTVRDHFKRNKVAFAYEVAVHFREEEPAPGDGGGSLTGAEDEAPAAEAEDVPAAAAAPTPAETGDVTIEQSCRDKIGALMPLVKEAAAPAWAAEDAESFRGHMAQARELWGKGRDSGFEPCLAALKAAEAVRDHAAATAVNRAKGLAAIVTLEDGIRKLAFAPEAAGLADLARQATEALQNRSDMGPGQALFTQLRGEIPGTVQAIRTRLRQAFDDKVASLTSGPAPVPGLDPLAAAFAEALKSDLAAATEVLKQVEALKAPDDKSDAPVDPRLIEALNRKLNELAPRARAMSEQVPARKAELAELFTAARNAVTAQDPTVADRSLTILEELLAFLGEQAQQDGKRRAALDATLAEVRSAVAKVKVADATLAPEIDVLLESVTDSLAEGELDQAEATLARLMPYASLVQAAENPQEFSDALMESFYGLWPMLNTVMTKRVAIADEIDQTRKDFLAAIEAGDALAAQKYLESLVEYSKLKPTPTEELGESSTILNLSFRKAMLNWNTVRKNTASDIATLKKAILDSEQGDPDFAWLSSQLVILDGVIQGLDDNLGDILDVAISASGVEAKTKAKAEALDQVQVYKDFAQSNKALTLIDDNPFVPLSTQKNILAAIRTLEQALT
ncbi:MAG: hypothetical protein P4M00_04365 [Azospirillaceae bacterium]|nr:hypothetical protein [Azospirillaceae bacterium]